MQNHLRESCTGVRTYCPDCRQRSVYCAAGSGNKQLLGKNLSKEMEEKMNARETICASRGELGYVPITEDETEGYCHEVMIPILAQGDIIGAVVLLANDENNPMSEVEVKLAQSAAGFLGKQIEQ